MTGPSAPTFPPGRAALPSRRRRPRPCDVPATPHDLTYARPYPCGWRCDRHSPWALAGRDGPESPAAPLTAPAPARA